MVLWKNMRLVAIKKRELQTKEELVGKNKILPQVEIPQVTLFQTDQSH